MPLDYFRQSFAKFLQAKNRPIRNSGRRLGVEVLEDRAMPAVYAVTNTLASGAGSLRQAILDANANAGADSIVFNIPVTDVNHVHYKNDGVAGRVTLANVATTTASDDLTIPDIDPDWAHSWYRIKPTSTLPFPTITGVVKIDGYTQPGSSENTLVDSDSAVLRIQPAHSKPRSLSRELFTSCSRPPARTWG